MKNLTILFLLAFITNFNAQNVVLNKVVKTHDNTDKVLYKINSDIPNAEYLAELEVQGFSNDDAKVFGLIYRKAKEVGANAYTYQPFPAVNTSEEFDPAHYRLNLYYVDVGSVPAENNQVYIIASPYKTQTIAINKMNKVFEARSYSKILLQPGAIYTISTRKLLGSTIRIGAQENQPVQYFQLSGASLNANRTGPGINLKSGDIIRLEKSYAQFLTLIYQYKP